MANDFDKLEPLELKEFRIIPLKTFQQTHHPNHLGLLYLLSMRRCPLGSGSGRMNPLGERRGAAGGAESPSPAAPLTPLRPFDCFWSRMTFLDSRVSLKLTFNKDTHSVKLKFKRRVRH